jgi:hypothetical protein
VLPARRQPRVLRGHLSSQTSKEEKFENTSRDCAGVLTARARRNCVVHPALLRLLPSPCISPALSSSRVSSLGALSNPRHQISLCAASTLLPVAPNCGNLCTDFRQRTTSPLPSHPSSHHRYLLSHVSLPLSSKSSRSPWDTDRLRLVLVRACISSTIPPAFTTTDADRSSFTKSRKFCRIHISFPRLTLASKPNATNSRYYQQQWKTVGELHSRR